MYARVLNSNDFCCKLLDIRDEEATVYEREEVDEAVEEVDVSRFNELYSDIRPSPAEQERTSLLTFDSIQKILNFVCKCLIPCPIRAGFTQLGVYAWRSSILQHSLWDGKRLIYLTDWVRPMRSFEAVHHPASASTGLRLAGHRARKLNLELNHTDVCSTVFAVATRSSETLLRNACEHSKNIPVGSGKNDYSQILQQAHELNSDVNILMAVQWIIGYAADSGAEMIPIFEDLERAARFQSVFGSIDELSLLRLNDCTLEALYQKYLDESNEGRKFIIIDLKDFRSTFKTDPRVLHICLARKRDAFSICTSCSDFKTQLSLKLTREQRAAVQHGWAMHLHLVWRERLAYVKKAQAPFVERSESIPRILYIRIALSFHIDKQTKNMTAVPSMHPWPKCASSADRLFYSLSSVVVHGVGYFVFLSTDAQSSGCDLTIEVIYRLLTCLQSHGYVFDSELDIQADNHTDNKTPAVLFFLAYLVSIGAFHVVVLAFLIVGHGHLCADQRHANNARALKSPNAFPIAPTRFRATLKSAFVAEAMKPTIVEVSGVRCWSDFFRPAMEHRTFERLACSGTSGDAQYLYCISRQPDGEVGLTYKKYASEDEVYPRRLQVGTVFSSEAHGAGTVVDSSFDVGSKMWVSTVAYHNGHSEEFRDPPQPIVMFPVQALIPTVAPTFESMAHDWPHKVKGIESNIRKCEEHLNIFSGAVPGVREDWAEFLDGQHARIAICAASPQTPWCAELSTITITPTPAPYKGPVPLRSQPPPLAVPFTVDPVTHNAYSSADRAALQREERATLIPGTMVVLKLKFGSLVPVHHKLPFCLAHVPASFVAAAHPDGELVTFETLFTKGTDLTMAWSAQHASCTLSAPLRSVLVSGVELTAARKLTAMSMRRMTSILSTYDLSA